MDLAPPLRLEAAADAAGAARRYVRRVLTDNGRSELVAAAELGASELVTNACLHARTALEIRVTAEPEAAVRIAVTDGSPIVPVQRRRSQLAGTGRGLSLVSAAGRWGVEVNEPQGKTVWFEPEAEIADEPDLAAWADFDEASWDAS